MNSAGQQVKAILILTSRVTLEMFQDILRKKFAFVVL